jgi:hypothetical protein
MVNIADFPRLVNRKKYHCDSRMKMTVLTAE